LTTLDAETARRRGIADRYRSSLAKVSGLVLPVAAAGTEAAWHQFVVRHPAREELRAHLERAGIAAGVLYPVPIHEQPAYRGRVLLTPGGLAETARAC